MIVKTLISMVAGVTYEGRQAILATLTGNEPCRLVPEPDNKYDPNAIKVMVATSSGVQHVGYIPKGIANVVSKAIDGEQAMCKLLGIVGDYEGGTLGLRVQIEVPLPDPPVVAKKSALIPPFDPHYANAWEDDEMFDFGDWGDQ